MPSPRLVPRISAAIAALATLPGTSFQLTAYAVNHVMDPDGNEFEVMWAAPRSVWPDRPGTWPLDLDAELGRHAKADAILARFQAAGGKVEWKTYTDDEVTGVFSHPQG